MAKIIVKSWREGFQRISFTQLQVGLLQMGLRESKDNTDSLLAGNEIVFEIEDVALAEEFLEKAEMTGADCLLENN